MIKRNIIVIDLKSFFASCECVERGLDPFKVNLVVANPNQGNGAITLAITPHLKAYGVKSRTRLYEIPKNIKYMIVKPRMSLYIKKSKEVISVFLDYVALEDLHVYSIDEAFLDLTNYLKLYKKSDYDIAKEIMDKIYEKTKLTSTCGIGPNMFLAKVAMDTEAKKCKFGIAKWTYDDVPNKLWVISPLSSIWGIGSRLEKRLNDLGIYSVYDLAHYDKNKLRDKFGIIGEELWNHANGFDEAVISDYKKESKSESYSHSQVLFKDYDGNNIKIIISEMIEVITSRLRANNKFCSTIGLGISYSKNVGGGFYHVIKVKPTDLDSVFLPTCMNIFDKFYEGLPIRRVSIVAGNLSKKDSVQLNLFEDIKKMEDEEKLGYAIDMVKQKYGKNCILKATSLLPDSTAIERNGKIGGHSA